MQRMVVALVRKLGLLLGTALLLAGCGVSAWPGRLRGSPAATGVPPVQTALSSSQRTLASLLVTPREIGTGFRLLGVRGGQLHRGPGLVSVSERFSGPSSAKLYIRLSRFATPGLARREFSVEERDIGRSSTVLPVQGIRLGDRWVEYRVESGTGKRRSTSFGILLVQEDELVSVVLSGAPESVSKDQVLAVAREQLGKIVGAL